MKQLVRALALIATCTLAGCADASPDTARGGVDPRLVPPPPPSRSATPTPTIKSAYGLNEWANVANVRIRAIEVRQEDSSQSNDRPDRAVLFEGCVQNGTYLFERDDFASSGDGYTQFRTSRSNFRDFPTPAFPFGDGRVSAGECAKGWVVFDTTEQTRLVNVAFAATRQTAAVWMFG